MGRSMVQCLMALLLSWLLLGAQASAMVIFQHTKGHLFRAARHCKATCLCPTSAFSKYLQTGNFTLEFASLPADFGPPIPPEGLTGLLLVADPEDACQALKLPPQEFTQRPWIALIARSQNIEGCTFDIKVAHAEAAGAVAAIVHDDTYEPLVLMAKDPRHADPFIPSAFISQKSGIMMKRLMVQGSTEVTLTSLSEELWLSMLFSAMAGFLAVNLVLGALWVVRRQRFGPGGVAGGGGGAGAGYGAMQQRQGLTSAQIRALPVVVYEEHPHPHPHQHQQQQQHGGSAGAAASTTTAGAAGAAAAGSGGRGEPGSEGQPGSEGSPEAPASESGSESGSKGGGTRHVCAICLENYCAGDKLRVLPCQHRYHTECIDQWLSSRRPNCPVCKADAMPREQDLEAGGDDGGAAAAGQHRAAAARLLGRLGVGWFVLRTRLANGGGSSGGGGSGQASEQQQLLLAGSRSSSPIPMGGTGSGRGAEAAGRSPTVATLGNFPHLIVSHRSAQPEITPAADALPAGLPPGTVPAAAVAAVAAPSASTPLRGALPPAQQGAAGATDSPGGGSGSGSGQPGASSLSASSSAVHLAMPDSTEGSETESEAE